MKPFARIALVSSLALMAALAGCKTGMFAPRTGQLFQTTRMCPGPGSFVYTTPLMMGVWGVQKRGGEWTIPIGIVGIPIAAAGFVVDECVVSPLAWSACHTTFASQNAISIFALSMSSTSLFPGRRSGGVSKKPITIGWMEKNSRKQQMRQARFRWTERFSWKAIAGYLVRTMQVGGTTRSSRRRR